VAAPAKASRVNPWWVLVGACTGLFVLMLDSTVVVLALPAIHADLDASLDGLQWVQNAYLLTLAATVVSAGRLGDILGRRAVFLAGMAGFAIGSIVSGSANDESVLVAGRVIQGLGGSALLALSLALTTDVFDRAALPRALGIWAAVSAVALALGPLVGGALIEGASWRWIFFINVPVALLGSAILLTRGRESRDPSASRVDLAGVAVLGAGLTAIVFALVQSDEWGWGSLRTLGLLAAGVGILAVFWRLEHQVHAPLVDFSLFRNGPYLGATAAAFALVGAYWSVMFFQPQYLQEQLGYSAITAGFLVLPITAPMAIFSPFSTRLISRFGPRTTMTAGMLIGLLGLVLQAALEDTTVYGRLLPGFLCFGVALALVYAPMSTAAMAAMPASKAGVASGVLAMNRVLAGALLLAVAGAVFQSVLPDAGAAVSSSEYAQAVSRALWPAIAVQAAGTILTWLLVRAPSEPPKPPTDLAQYHQHHRRFHF
jgi:EmrB/QacA subfamily drug resistance transporter